jgi:hypothetical protein
MVDFVVQEGIYIMKTIHWTFAVACMHVNTDKNMQAYVQT